ncbi:putative Plant/MZA15-19 protein [Melia azedarach]|uniref:Plant/MZA15-19 protein n=1 Tax=Melia azedarach TaxID=155640 RepID=A0ACC1YYY3_MELAZ|nr:putative Plant/MZA15-19 protein [Melia azedarach]
MNLNCLACQNLQRTNSDKDYGHEGHHHLRKLCCLKVERSWSGNLAPPPYEQISKGSRVVAAKKVKKSHRRINSTGAVAFESNNSEPKLVRSVGMRRDWSFEDLRQRNENRKGNGGRLSINK